jgi:hypothetical protein
MNLISIARPSIPPTAATLPHPRFQFDGLSVNNECTVPPVVKGLAVLLRWIDPSLQHFENKNVIFVHETRVDYFAFKISKTFFDKWGRYPR